MIGLLVLMEFVEFMTKTDRRRSEPLIICHWRDGSSSIHHPIVVCSPCVCHWRFQFTSNTCGALDTKAALTSSKNCGAGTANSKATAAQTGAANKQTKQTIRHPRHFSTIKNRRQWNQVIACTARFRETLLFYERSNYSFLQLWGSQVFGVLTNTLLSGNNPLVPRHDRFIYWKGDQENKWNCSAIQEALLPAAYWTPQKMLQATQFIT